MRSAGRTAASAALATVAIGGAVALANPASDSVTTLTVKPTSTKAGTKKKPKAMTVSATIKGTTKSGTGQPSVPTAIDTELPSTWRINAGRWPIKQTCDPVEADKAKSDLKVCPKGSLVGTGTTAAKAGGLDAKLVVRAYALRTREIGFWIQTSRPVAINQMLRAKIVKHGRGFNVAIPKNVAEPVTGLTSAITLLKIDFKAKTKIKVHGKTKTIGGVESSGCKRGTWTFKTTIVFRDGQASDTDDVKCHA